ncbi:MAG TPA: ABC transporter permease [Bryobacteraceae bacterium]|jgi:predicted permease|nr:ABC transporter permease [Bryobacteraceae bacterium]
MSGLRTLTARLGALFCRRRDEESLADEIADHLESLATEYRRRGLSADDARAAARREFGGVDQIKERVRDQRGFLWFDMLRRDVRYAVRSLSRAPAFTLAAVGTLALGIGATTAIFSVANAALLRPLPYPHSEDLRTVRTKFTDGRVTSGLVGPLEMTRLKCPGPCSESPALPIVNAAMSLRQDMTLLLRDGTPRALAASGVDEGFFPLFGVPLILGGGFTPEHFQRNGPSGAVISTRLWKSAFAGDPGIVGKALTLATGNMLILGVAAPDMDVPRGTDVWFNVQLDPQSTDHSFEGYLRVRPRTSPEVLSSQLAAVAAGLGRDFPGPERNRAFVIQPFVDAVVGDLRPVLIIVFSATALLFVLACVNVANLQLARASRRSREVAIRAAVGAGRVRIATQLLTESVVLATTGMLAGVAVAYVAVRVLLRYGASQLPRLQTVPFDTPVLLFAIAMLVVCALGVGFAPVLQLAGPGIEESLRERARTAGATRSTHRALRTMIVAEVAVAVTIVAGTGLLVRSFLNLQRNDPGFVSRGRLTFDVLLPFQKYRGPGVQSAWQQTLFTNLRSIRGVTAVAGSSDFPLQPDNGGSRPLIQLDGWTDAHEHEVSPMHVVSPAFFDAMGMRLERGRAFTADDRPTTAQVAIVNESFARKYIGDRDPLTAQVSYGFPRVNPATKSAIVGVVDDVKYGSLWSSADPAFYLVDNQVGNAFRLHVVIATDFSDPRVVIPEVRAAVQMMDPQLAFTVEPVNEVVAATLTRQKLGTTLMLLFGMVALLLAAIGIYGMIAYSSAERHSEVATRMALGATRANIFGLLARQGLVVAAAGAAIGVGIADGAGRLASSWLYEVRPSDPWILGSALAVVVGVTVVATLIPVGRAARIDPAPLLRLE